MTRRTIMILTAVVGSWYCGCAAHAQPCVASASPDDPEVVADDDPGLPRPRSVRGPAVGDVLAAAYASAGLDRDPSRGWIRRARLAGLVPSVGVRTGRNTHWQTAEPDVAHGLAIEVRATWRLDRLVFDGRELQVASIEAARRRERRRLASQVVRLYYAWRRAAERGARVRADEAAAELDALTDGWFSEARFRTQRVAAPRRRLHPQ